MMSAFTSPPSPPLDVVSSSPSSAFLVGWHVASTLPGRIWDAYVAYLWYNQPDSWVGRLASTFRILAVIIILPVLLLTLLDVTSYVIARTLGIVEDLKASTSDADASDARDKAGPALVPVPTATTTGAYLSSPSSPSSATTPSLSSHDAGVDDGGPARAPEHTEERPSERDKQPEASQDASDAYSFVGGADGRLAGEGVFSPVASAPASPLATRVPLRASTEGDGGEVGRANEEAVLRRRAQGVDARADTLDRA